MNRLPWMASLLLVVALLAPASAHNGGPGTSGSCGAALCEDQQIGNGCGNESEVYVTGVDGHEQPCAHFPLVDHDRWSSNPCKGAPGCTSTEVRGGVSGRYVGSSGAGSEMTGSETSLLTPVEASP